MARIEQRGHRAWVTLGYQFLQRCADGAALPWPEPDVPSGGIHSWDQPCDELRAVWAEVRRLCIGSRGQYRTQRIVLTPV